jgi:hypothetical protein
LIAFDRDVKKIFVDAINVRMFLGVMEQVQINSSTAQKLRVQ